MFHFSLIRRPGKFEASESEKIVTKLFPHSDYFPIIRHSDHTRPYMSSCYDVFSVVKGDQCHD